MAITRPNELLLLLASLGVKPKKSLGQNFLIDGNIVRKIVQVADLEHTEAILEIGPGPGALTEALLEKNIPVYAVEKDTQFASSLALRFPQAHVYEEDILTFDFNRLPKSSFKVVSNLPYHLTSPIFERFLPRNDLFTSLTFMVQEEMARRIVACAGSSDFCSLSVFVQFYASATYAFKVSRHCFYPAPKVDSAIITLELKNPPAVNSQAFFSFVKSGFQQRRKQVVNSLGSIVGKEKIYQALQQLKLLSDSRPEDLTLRNFLDIFKLVTTEDLIEGKN